MSLHETLDAISPLGNPVGRTYALEGAAPGDVRLTELADRGAVLCSVAGPAGLYAHELSNVVSCTMPETAGPVRRGEQGREAIWLSPRSWLLLCRPDEEEDVITAIAAAWPDRMVHGSLYGSALCWLSLTGTDAEAALRQGSFLTMDAAGFPIHHTKRTLLASIPALLIRDDTNSWRIGVERSRSRYFMTWLGSLTLFRGIS